jgi:ABC-2 type transport system permease protein
MTSAKNRWRAAMLRTRRPRYAAALVVGILYLWAFLLRPMGRGPAMPGLVSQPTEMIVTVLAVLTLMGSWVFGSDSTPLAFSQAEVSFLFPAPLTRRSLIGYKLFRAQIAVLINALIWVFVLRRGGTALPPLLRAVSLWALFSTLNMHRLGAALVRSSWREHGGAGLKRNRWAALVFAVVGVALVWSLVEHRDSLAMSEGPGPFFRGLGSAFASAPASWALFPFHLVVAPTFAESAAEWRHVIVPALVVLAGHAWWVLRADTAFEDAAIEASAERARRLEAMRNRRVLGAAAPPRRVTSTLALASVGHPALAIIWKNMLCLRRTAQLRVFIGPLAMAVILGGAFSAEGDVRAIIATSALILAGMLLVFGGRMIRNDMRQDMQHLALLKVLPIASTELMLAEVASSALPMAALQLSLLIVAFVAAALTNYALIDEGVRLGCMLAAPVAVLALNLALMTIQNGTAVLFPAWVRLGPTVATGVEALGQNVLATAANLVSLAIGLVIPSIVGFLIVRASGGPSVLALAIALVAASALLAAETIGALKVLGRAFAKAEPG